MIQVFLEDVTGQVTEVITDINGLTTALNDQAIMSQTSFTGLLDYLARNHFHTKIGGVLYSLSKVSMGTGKPVTIVFAELNQPKHGVQYRVILKDKSGNIILDDVKDNAGIAAMLNDQAIHNITDEAQLEFYLISHHYITLINGTPFMHTKYSVGKGLMHTFVFEER